MERMYSFLQQYQVEKGSDFTHTSIIKPSGSFYIPGEKLNEFFKIYTAASKSGNDLYLTEKPRDIIPILIDLDFRFTKESINRKYTFEDVKNIAKLYIKTIKETIETPETFKVYIMEKPAPVINKELVKDGIHIVIPEVITKSSVQLFIRQEILKGIPSILDHLNLCNSYHDVVDEAVITTNNWQMYGSKKPNCEPYKITHIFDDNMVELELNDADDYVNILSLRNKYDECETKIDKLNMVKEIQNDILKKKKDKMMKNTSIFQNSQNIKKNTCDDIDYINRLLNILKIDRADNYGLWIRLGWCLRNIDHRLLTSWIDFSKRSRKFTDGECERIWNYMKDDGLGIGSLHMWAREDSPDQYKEIIRTDLNRLIDKASSETHTDIATAVYNMYKYEFVCISIKNNLWYEFKNHRWNLCDSAHTLRMNISSVVSQEFSRRSAYWSQKASIEEEEGEQNRCNEKAKKLVTIAMNLKKVSFKENILKESRDIFYQTKFEEKLDSRSHLIGFENGVYDLESKEFREGRPEDFIMFTTGINYQPYDPANIYAIEIDDFLSKVFTNPNMKEYITSLFASFLNGNIRQERFHIWTGSGCFAKDTQIMMHNGSSKNVQDVIVGDVLMGDDSTPRNVQQLFTGYSDMYKIIPIKGDPFVVNGQHILVVKNKIGQIIKHTVHEYLNLSDKNDLYLYRPHIIHFEEQEIDIDPLTLGYDPIPYEYKINSVDIRTKILKGIIDARGTEITDKNETLIDDIKWLARSLGFSCYKSKIDDKFNIIITNDPLILSFKVERIEDDNFYGFELDANKKFLMGDGDFTVLHNSNGKSKIIDLFETCFGEYCCKLPITLLTQKRAAANAATSELARTKGKRFACLQEPSEDEKLNVGLMKELSGGDKIQARLLYKEPIEFKPQFKMILTCNHLPSVPSDDGGTWRRIRVAEFTSRFCENPDPEKTNEFAMDTTLSDKFDFWKEQFMALLIDKYINKIAENGVAEPEEVMICTKEYQKANDIYAEFISTETEKHEMEYITNSDLMNSFKSFLKDNNVVATPALIKKSNFVKNMEKAFGKICYANGVEIWKGCRFKLNRFVSQEDELDK